MTNHSNEQKNWKRLVADLFEKNQMYKFTRDVNGKIWRHSRSNSSVEQRLTDSNLDSLARTKRNYLKKKKKDIRNYSGCHFHD